jgi:hypothetical protein
MRRDPAQWTDEYALTLWKSKRRRGTLIVP